MDATGYLKHNATVQVASGAVDCLFARELIRQFVVQNPAEVTDKANGERTVMSARCYWKPGDGADRATPECVSLDGGSTVITAVSYTHLDVYKRQECARRIVNYSYPSTRLEAAEAGCEHTLHITPLRLSLIHISTREGSCLT